MTTTTPTPSGSAAGVAQSDTFVNRTTATAREIAQQPDMWREVAETLAAKHGQTDAFLQPLLDRLDLRIVLTGAGTSAFVGGILAPALSRELGRRVDAVATTDIVSNPSEMFAEDVPTLLVSFARSGDSPESYAATMLADRRLTFVRHLIVTCNEDGLLARKHSGSGRSLVLLMPAASNDRGFAMTSSFTCMLLAAWIALTPAMPDASLVDRLALSGEHVLQDWAALAADLAARGYRRVVYLGSGPLTALARESALKMLELTAGHVGSYFDSALGFRHGPKSVLNEHTLTVVYVSNDTYTRKYDEDIAEEVLQGADPNDVVIVAARRSGRFDAASLCQIRQLDDVPDVLLVLPYILVAQMLALNSSLSLGLDPDSPFPAGQVNRVVQGVTIHGLDGGR